MDAINYQYKISEETYKNTIFKIAILVTVIFELVLIYFFAVKNAGILALGLIAGFTFIISSFLDPRIGVIAIVGLVYSDIGTFIGSGIFSALLIYVFITWLLSFIANSKELVKHNTNIYIVIFTLFIVISISVAEVNKLAIEQFSEYLKAIIIYFLVINLIDSKKVIKYIYVVIVGISTILALYAIYKFFNSVQAAMRLSVGERDPNLFAMILLTAIPIAVSLMKNQRNRVLKFIFFIISIIISATILMTFSRGGMIALGTVILWIVYNERKRKFFPIVLILFFCALIYFFVAQFGEYKELIRLVTKDRSFLQRLQLYKGGIQMFLSNPIFGVGLGNFIVWSTRYTGLVMSLYAHNIFLHIAAETGVGGLISYCLILGSAWFSLFKNQKIAINMDDSKLINLIVGLKISMFGFFMAGMFLSQHLNKVLWILLGLSIALNRITYEIKSNLHPN